MIDQRGRSLAGRLTEPVGRGLARLGLSAAAVTLLGLVVTVAGAVLVSFGYLVAGGLVVGLGSLIDAFDGAVARTLGTVSKRGAFLDTASDRLGELAIWAGTAAYVSGDQQRVVLVTVALGASLITPFLRARAELEGLSGKGGLAGRAERIIIYCAGVVLEGLGLPALLPMLWVMAIVTGLTVLQRFTRTWVRLST